MVKSSSVYGVASSLDFVSSFTISLTSIIGCPKSDCTFPFIRTVSSADPPEVTFLIMHANIDHLLIFGRRDAIPDLYSYV